MEGQRSCGIVSPAYGSERFGWPHSWEGQEGVSIPSHVRWGVDGVCMLVDNKVDVHIDQGHLIASNMAKRLDNRTVSCSNMITSISSSKVSRESKTAEIGRLGSPTKYISATQHRQRL